MKGLNQSQQKNLIYPIRFCGAKLVNISITLIKSEDNLTIFISEKTSANYSAFIYIITETAGYSE